MIPAPFFERDPVDCARDLVGCELVWDDCAGRIVETEAYYAIGDEACHTFTRKGARLFVAGHPAGTAYIYLNYGMHWLFNVLIRGPVDGFVLVRALEPTAGIEKMRERRGLNEPRHLCSGPGKLTAAMGITGREHGRSLCESATRGFRGVNRPGLLMSDVRIGISKSVDLPWRFLLAGSPYVSVLPGKQKRLRGNEKRSAGQTEKDQAV